MPTWKHQHRPRFDAIEQHIPRDADTTLCVGAAPYHLCNRVVCAAPDADHYGINLGDGDNYQHVVGGETVTIRECNVEADRWPFDDDSMDVVVMGAIIEHLLDPAAALREARRVCRPNGRLVLSTPNATRLIQRARTVLGENPFDGFDAVSEYHRHNHEWTHAELVDALDATGWDVTWSGTVALTRHGVAGSLYQGLASARDAWNDQLVVTASPNRAAEPRQPSVYRESVVARADGGES